MGDQVSAENYNQVLYRQGNGCLPAKLGDRQGDADRRDDVFAFDPGEFAHPISRRLSGKTPRRGSNAPSATRTSRRRYLSEMPRAWRSPLIRETPPSSSARSAAAEACSSRPRSMSAGEPGLSGRVFSRSFTKSSSSPFRDAGRTSETGGRAAHRDLPDDRRRCRHRRRSARRRDAHRARRPARFGQSFTYEINEAGAYEVDSPTRARSEPSAVNVDPRESNLAKSPSRKSRKTCWPGRNSPT